MLYAMVCGTVPFKGFNADELKRRIVKDEIDLKHSISNRVKDLISNILKKNPDERMSL